MSTNGNGNRNIQSSPTSLKHGSEGKEKMKRKGWANRKHRTDSKLDDGYPDQPMESKAMPNFSTADRGFGYYGGQP